MSCRIDSLTDAAVSVGKTLSLPSGNGSGAVGSPTVAKKIPRAQLGSFPATMPLGQFLFEYLYQRGVRHSFGIPGDFALPTFTWLEKSKIRSITVTHEPAAGFAADAYSRINGIGLVCVTYCVGGLNVVNAIAGAYAEKSPVVVVSGAPGRRVAIATRRFTPRLSADRRPWSFGRVASFPLV